MRRGTNSLEDVPRVRNVVHPHEGARPQNKPRRHGDPEYVATSRGGSITEPPRLCAAVVKNSLGLKPEPADVGYGLMGGKTP
jgi:hypothetical protein